MAGNGEWEMENEYDDKDTCCISIGHPAGANGDAGGTFEGFIGVQMGIEKGDMKKILGI